MTIDETTGLPALPEGQVWRITNGDGSSSSWLEIAIVETRTVQVPERQVRKRWRTVTMPAYEGEVRQVVAKDICQPYNVVEVATDILRRINIVGYYPPKRLPDE